MKLKEENSLQEFVLASHAWQPQTFDFILAFVEPEFSKEKNVLSYSL